MRKEYKKPSAEIVHVKCNYLLDEVIIGPNSRGEKIPIVGAKRNTFTQEETFQPVKGFTSANLWEENE